MLDFDAGKLFIIGIVALLVIGPKDLPRLLRQLGQWTGKMRRMAGEFRGQFMDAMREADFDSLKKEVHDLSSAAELHTNFDPAADIHRELTQALDSKPPEPLAAPAEPLPTLATAAAAADGPSGDDAHNRVSTSENIPAAPATEPYATFRDGNTHAIVAEIPASKDAGSEQSAPAALTPPAPSAATAMPASRNVLGASRGDARAAAARQRTERTRAAAASFRRSPPTAAEGSASVPAAENAPAS